MVELFTSEGCSSCPPADRVLAELARWADSQNAPVLTMAFHVDYWNQLGWQDPGSAAEYSERQRWYGERLGHSRVYTPELVIGGTVEVVGSHRGKAFASLKADLKKPGAGELNLAAKRVGQSIEVTYVVSGYESAMLLNVALLQRFAETRVSRGENQGRVLRHLDVVRRFATVTVRSETGELTLATVRGVAAPRIAAFVQHPQSLSISTADWVDLPADG